MTVPRPSSWNSLAGRVAADIPEPQRPLGSEAQVRPSLNPAQAHRRS